jgi:hypothetical protein
MACSSNNVDLSLPTRTLVPPQEKSSVIVISSTPSPTIVKSQPPTLTTIPTKALEEEQPLPENTEVPTVLPSLLPPTVAAPMLASTLEVSAVAPAPTTTATEETVPYTVYNIGQSSRGFPLTAYQFNNGPQHIIIVGGIHGGYEWNTILLAYEAIDYFLNHPKALPDTVTLTIIPSANPDGQELVTGKTSYFTVADLASDTFPGRFNGNNVDLNRNWDCQWTQTAKWRDQVISGGERSFSEPETIVLRDFFLQHQPEAVIFLHSAANGVFASGCPDTHQPSMDLASIYGQAAGYPVYERFSAYDVTGDAGDWLTTRGITSISVELKNHENLDLEQNLAGMLAVLNQYQ